MKNFKLGWLAAAAAAAVLAACGGGGDGNQAPAVKYGKLVSFGDSLSDVGSYAVSGVLASGGGKYIVNNVDPATGKNSAKNWTELLAAQAAVGAPCPAQTGLNAIQAVVGFPPAPATYHDGCFSYAQGGARVTAAVGPGNVNLFNAADPTTYSNAVGQLTVPIKAQIQRHLDVSTKFAGDDLVTVMAGGNDVFINLAIVQATIKAGGDATAAATAAVTAMGQAGAELAAYVKNMIVANGATHVVVVNLPDVSKTPMGQNSSAATQGLILQMVSTFNQQLAAGLGTSAEIVLVDAFTVSQDQFAHKEQYGLSNVTATACDMSKVGSSLLCSAATLVSGDVSTYQYADTVHPTPYGYKLLAQLVTDNLLKKGWL